MDLLSKPRPRLSSMRRSSRFLFRLAVCGVLFQSLPAAAQESDEELAPAHLQYRKAFDFMREKRWVEARRLLLDLWLKSRTYDVAASLGQVEYQLRNYSLGARYLAFALANVPPMEKPETIERFKTAFEEVRKLVAVVTVSVHPAESTLYVDGAPVEVDSTHAVYLDPGVHSFEARLKAGNSTARELDLKAGESYRLDLQVNLSASGAGAATATAPEPHPAEGGDSHSHNERTLVPAYIGAGVTAVGVGLAVAFGSAARSAKKDAEALRARVGASGCSNRTASAADCSAALDAYDRQRSDATLAKVGLGIAVVGGVATAGYLVYALFSDQDSRNSKSVRPTLAFDGRQLGMSVSGSF